MSVVIPAYNAQSTLPATLASVRSQTHANLEVLVVDDGSTDATAEVIDRAAAVDQRVRRLDQGGNRGRSSARNFAIEASEGDWVSFVDADDLWAPDRVEALLVASSHWPRSRVLFDDRLQFEVRPDGRVELGHRYPTRQTVWRRDPIEIDRRSWMIDRGCRMDPVVDGPFLRGSGIRYPSDLAIAEDLCVTAQLAFWPEPTRPLHVGRPSYYYRMEATARSARAADSWLSGMHRAIEVTGSVELAELVEAMSPSWMWMADRADGVHESEGRLMDADAGGIDVGVARSAWRGWRRLVGWRILQEACVLADRPIRAGITADIERQLSVDGT